MKSQDLIKRLLELDPSGQTEVICDGGDIYFVDKLPAYYDGALRTLIRDPKKAPYYDIVGMEERRDGDKISLKIMGLDDVVFDDAENKNTYKGGEYFMAEVGRLQTQREEIYFKTDMEAFKEFLYLNFKDIFEKGCNWKEFFVRNEKELRRRDFNSIGSSFRDKQTKYWLDCVAVDGRELKYVPGFENKEY